MGALGTTLRNAIAPVARSLISSVGRSVVELRRLVTPPPRNADNSEIRTFAIVSGGGALECPILDLTEEAAAREWGAMQQVTAVAIISDVVNVQPNDGLVVSSGDCAGEHFKVVDVHPAPIAGLQRVALQTTLERYS